MSPPPADDVLFRRGLFLAGELDLTGATVASVLNRPADTATNKDRLFNLLGALGTLVGKDREDNAVQFSSPVIVTVEDLP